jgi:hypothetical protein
MTSVAATLPDMESINAGFKNFPTIRLPIRTRNMTIMSVSLRPHQCNAMRVMT